MNPTFRRRVFTPYLLPLTVLGGILLYAFSLSRVLLAVSEMVAVVIGTGVAAYVLFMAAVVTSRREISGRALGGGLVVGMIGVLAAGAIAAAAGPRDFHHEEEGAGAAEEGGAAAVEIPADALVWTAASGLEYTSAPSEGPAGDVTVAIEVEGSLPHNVVLEGVNNDAPLVEATDGVDVATISIDPGTYTYYCSIAGHREAGMEGQITFN